MARIVDNTNQQAAPRWAGDFGSPELGLMRGPLRLDVAQWQTYTISANGAALAAATSITVDPLPVALPAGAVLDFTGTGELAKLTANAAVGATTISVVALDAGIEDNDTSTYTVTPQDVVTIPSGTVVGRTTAEAALNTDFGPADAADNEIYIVYFDVWDASVNPDFVGYRPYAGRTVKINYLPDYATLAAGVITALRARYNCVLGTN